VNELEGLNLGKMLDGGLQKYIRMKKNAAISEVNNNNNKKKKFLLSLQLSYPFFYYLSPFLPYS